MSYVRSLRQYTIILTKGIGRREGIKSIQVGWLELDPTVNYILRLGVSTLKIIAIKKSAGTSPSKWLMCSG